MDPCVAISKARELYDEFGDRVTLPDSLHDENFSRAVHEHRTRVVQLRAAGLLGANAALVRELLDRVMADVPPRMPLSPDDVYVLHAALQLPTFTTRVVSGYFRNANDLVLPPSRWSNRGEPDILGIFESVPGSVHGYVLRGRYAYVSFKGGREVEDSRSWDEKFRDVGGHLVYTVMQELLEQRLGPVEYDLTP